MFAMLLVYTTRKCESHTVIIPLDAELWGQRRGPDEGDHQITC